MHIVKKMNLYVGSIKNMANEIKPYASTAGLGMGLGYGYDG